MSDDIEVSVLCATFNQEKYIRRCLGSLVSQKTTFKYEILVHDDASVDGTRTIVREFAQKYPEIVRPFYQEQNQFSRGKRITKEYQFPRAKGRYIAFCEGDDFWIDSEKLQKQYDALTLHPQCSACVAKTKCCNEDESDNERVIPDKRINLATGTVPAEDACALIYGGYAFQTSSFFLRREVLQYAFSMKCLQTINGDEAYLMAAVCLGDVYYIEHPMSMYRLSAKGSWNEKFSHWDRQKIETHQLKIQNARFQFFCQTGYRFRKQTISYLIHRCDIKDKAYLDSVLNDCGITMSEVYRCCDLKHRLIFIAIRSLPFIWTYYRGHKPK